MINVMAVKNPKYHHHIKPETGFNIVTVYPDKYRRYDIYCFVAPEESVSDRQATRLSVSYCRWCYYPPDGMDPINALIECLPSITFRGVDGSIVEAFRSIGYHVTVDREGEKRLPVTDFVVVSTNYKYHQAKGTIPVDCTDTFESIERKIWQRGDD